MFPKNLFHVWYQGCENITNKRYNLNKEAWKNFNPTWKYHCLGEADIVAACTEYSPECLAAIQRTTNLHTKIDLGRLVVLYLNGGVNIDMDMYALRPIEFSEKINDMIALGNTGADVLGVSINNLNIVEKMCAQQSTRNVFNNAFLASSQRNPVLRVVIDKFIDNIMSLKETGGGHWYVDKTTGPFMFSNTIHVALDRYNDTNTLFEFDHKVFEPCDVSGNCSVTDDTIAIHKFELSWIPKNVQRVAKFYVSYKLLVYVSLLCAMYFIYKFFYKQSV